MVNLVLGWSIYQGRCESTLIVEKGLVFMWLVLLCLGGLSHYTVSAISHVRREPTTKARARKLLQPAKSFGLDCQLELTSQPLTDQIFSNFVSSYCKNNAPGPACFEYYSFRELPQKVQLPFVATACPKDADEKITCLQNLIESGRPFVFKGDIGPLCVITELMMKESYMLGEDDVSRSNHYYGDTVVRPVVESANPINYDLILRQHKIVSIEQDKIDVATLQTANLNPDDYESLKVKAFDLKIDDNEDIVFDDVMLDPMEDKTSQVNQKIGLKTDKKGKSKVNFEDKNDMTTSSKNLVEAESNNTEDDVHIGGKIKKAYKAGDSGSEPPFRSPVSSSPSVLSHNADAEDFLEEEEGGLSLEPTPTPVSIDINDTTRVESFKNSNASQNPITKESSGVFRNHTESENSSSSAGIITGAAVAVVAVLFVVSSIRKGKKRKRKKQQWFDPALHGDASLTSEPSHINEKDTDWGESMKQSATNKRKSMPFYRAAAPQPQDAPEHIILVPASIVNQDNQQRSIYLEDSVGISLQGLSRGNESLTLNSDSAQRNDALVNGESPSRETLAEVLAIAEEQKQMFLNAETLKHPPKEVVLVNENLSFISLPEAKPFDMLDKDEFTTETIPHRSRPLNAYKFWLRRQNKTCNKSKSAIGDPLIDTHAVPTSNKIKEKSHLLLTKPKNRDHRDISQEIEDGGIRPWQSHRNSTLSTMKCDRKLVRKDETLPDTHVKSTSELSRRSVVESAFRAPFADDESSIGGGSFLSPDILTKFREVDKCLSDGFEDFNETERRMSRNLNKLDEQYGECVESLQAQVTSSSTILAAHEDIIKSSFIESDDQSSEALQSHRRAQYAVGAISCESDHCSSIRPNLRSQSALHGSIEEALCCLRKTNRDEYSELGSGNVVKEADVEIIEEEVEVEVVEEDIEVEMAEEEVVEEEWEEEEVLSDEEITDFNSLRNRFAAGWYHPPHQDQRQLQNKLICERNSTPPPTQFSNVDFAERPIMSLLQPTVSSDDEESPL